PRRRGRVSEGARRVLLPVPQQRVQEDGLSAREKSEPARARCAARRDSRGRRGVGLFRELQVGHRGEGFDRVMKRLLDWLDHRTGFRAITNEALYEHIPGGARWRYIWGSTLT